MSNRSSMKVFGYLIPGRVSLVPSERIGTRVSKPIGIDFWTTLKAWIFQTNRFPSPLPLICFTKWYPEEGVKGRRGRGGNEQHEILCCRIKFVDTFGMINETTLVGGGWKTVTISGSSVKWWRFFWRDWGGRGWLLVWNKEGYGPLRTNVHTRRRRRGVRRRKEYVL